MSAAAVSRFYATGKRKNSIARVWMMPGSGKITINERPADQYFGRDVLKMIIRQPFEVTGTTDKFDVLATVAGGGETGQAGAIRHGISKALLSVDTEAKGKLRKEGLLTRDPRSKERKKYGQKGARARDERRELNVSSSGITVLCDRQAEEFDRAGLDDARQREDHDQ